MFCTGTMGELASVVKVDGRTIGTGEVGAMTARLAKTYRDYASGAGVDVVGSRPT